MQYRCPRTRHVMTLEMCQGRRTRRHPGCVSCTFPNKVRRDQKRIARLSVKLTTDQTKARNLLVVIAGLAPQPIVVTPRVAEALAKMIKEALEA